jgi:hypothetical protein
MKKESSLINLRKYEVLLNNTVIKELYYAGDEEKIMVPFSSKNIIEGTNFLTLRWKEGILLIILKNLRLQ